MPAPITPESFGAAGDGATDDTLPLESAMNSGKPVQLIGRYRITRTIAIGIPQSVRGLTMLGYGRQSQIILGAENASLWVDMPHVANPWGTNTQALLLRDFVIIPDSTSTGVAMYVQGPAVSGSCEPTFCVDNVHVVPTGPTKYTNAGLQLHNMRNGSVTNCDMAGRYASYPVIGNSGGLVITSSASPPRSNPVGINVARCRFTNFAKGVFLHGSGPDPANPSDWQGITIADSIMLDCAIGVHAWTTDKFSAHLQIKGCHMNVRQYAIYAPNVWHPYYVGNNIQFMDGESSVVGIDCSASNQNWPMFGHIKDNFMSFNRSQPLTSGVGIFCGASGGNPGGAWSVVGDNSFWKGNCATLTPVLVTGGTVYQHDNGGPTNRTPI